MTTKSATDSAPERIVAFSCWDGQGQRLSFFCPSKHILYDFKDTPYIRQDISDAAVAAAWREAAKIAGKWEETYSGDGIDNAAIAAGRIHLEIKATAIRETGDE